MKKMLNFTWLISLFLAVSPCYGNSITFSFSGTLFRVDEPLTPRFQIGQSFNVSYTFDSLAPDRNPAPNQGSYSVADFIGYVGDYLISNSSPFIVVVNNYPNTGDQYWIYNNNFIGDTVGEATIAGANLMFRDFNTIQFDDDSLPLDAAYLFSAFTKKELSLYFDYQDTRVFAVGNIKTFSQQNSTTVPLSSSIYYLIVGVFGTTIIRSKHNQGIKLTARTVCGLSGKLFGAAAYTRLMF